MGGSSSTSSIAVVGRISSVPSCCFDKISVFLYLCCFEIYENKGKFKCWIGFRVDHVKTEKRKRRNGRRKNKSGRTRKVRCSLSQRPCLTETVTFHVLPEIYPRNENRFHVNYACRYVHLKITIYGTKLVQKTGESEKKMKICERLETKRRRQPISLSPSPIHPSTLLFIRLLRPQKVLNTTRQVIK